MNEGHPSLVSISWLREWWPVLWPLTMVAAGVVLLWMRSQFPTLVQFDRVKAGLESIKDRLDVVDVTVRGLPTRDEVQDLNLRIVDLTQRIAHLPARDDVHELGLGVRGLQGEIAALQAGFKPLQMAVGRIEDHLLNGARK
jgi:Protein of unknown function (DUF2730)